MSVTELFGALAGLPRFDSPACTDHIWLYDEAVGDRNPGVATAETSFARRTCIEICGSCESLQPCREWLLSLPKSKRPLGVCGGLVITPQTRGEAE